MATQNTFRSADGKCKSIKCHAVHDTVGDYSVKMRAPVCVCGAGANTGNAHREFPEGSHVGALEVFTFTSGLCKVDSYPLLLKRQAASAARLPPPPTCVSNWVGPLSIHGGWRASKAPAAGGLREALVTRLPSPGPLAHRSPSLCSRAPGKLLSAPVDLITAGPIPHDTMHS